VLEILESMVFELETSRSDVGSRLWSALNECSSNNNNDMIEFVRHVFPIVVDVQVETLRAFNNKQKKEHCYRIPPGTIDGKGELFQPVLINYFATFANSEMVAGLREFLTLASAIESSDSTPLQTGEKILSLRLLLRSVYMNVNSE